MTKTDWLNFSEWLNYYRDKTGCDDLQLADDEHVLFHPDFGFVTFFTHDDVLELHHMCGNGKKWQELLVQIMKDNGLTKLRAFTRRNPKAWIRKYGGHIRGYYMESDIEEMKI